MLMPVVWGIVGVLVLLVVVVSVIVASQPAQFRVERSGTIDAPPHIIFPQVNEFRNWDAWSPWAKLDPEMKQTYAGPPGGTGAEYSWSGNSKVGEGHMQILECSPPNSVRIQLDFKRPFKATNYSDFQFVPEGGATRVTWSMTGHKNFITKAMHMLMNIDSLIGKDFEKGLASLKTRVEAV